MGVTTRKLGVVVASVLGVMLMTASALAAPTPVAIANAGVLGTMVTALKTLVPNTTITNTTGGSVALAQGIEAGRSPPTSSAAPTRASTSSCSVTRTTTRSAGLRRSRATRS